MPVAPDLSHALAPLPSLADEIRAAGLVPERALGQNFLLDPRLLDRIAGLVPMEAGETVYEVGPGPGGLTRALLRRGARVVAVERDRRAIPVLERLAAASGQRLCVIEGDAMAADARGLAGHGVHLAANLPYNIATALLIGWLSDEPWPAWWRSATLMFQREVAARIVAAPGSPAYGRLSVLAQWRADVRIGLRLPPGAFTPPPKVESAVVLLVPRPPAFPLRLRTLEKVTAAAFGQRRKMLRQALKSLPGAVEALPSLGIDPQARAETLSVSAFARLAKALDGGPADS